MEVERLVRGFYGLFWRGGWFVSGVKINHCKCLTINELCAQKNFVLTASLSTTYDDFVRPALQLLADCSKTRVCPSMSDADWVSMGIQRVVQECSSGRAFLQTHGARLKSCPEISLYFHSLKSERRLKVLTEVNGRLLSQLAKFLPDELGEYPQLANFDVYAGDGHWHEAAAHDPASTTRPMPPDTSTP